MRKRIGIRVAGKGCDIFFCVLDCCFAIAGRSCHNRPRGSASSSWPRDPTPRHACGPFAPNRAESRWENGSIWTITTFDVVETFKGSLPRQIAVAGRPRRPSGSPPWRVRRNRSRKRGRRISAAVARGADSPSRDGFRGIRISRDARSGRRNRDAGFQRLRGFRRVLYPDPTDSVHVGAISGRVLPANPRPSHAAGVTGIFPA